MKKTIIRRSIVLLLVLCIAMVSVITVSAKSPGAVLTLSDLQSREVISYTFTMTHPVDLTGLMTGCVEGGTITIEVKPTNDGNSELLAWSLSIGQMKDGMIEIMDSATGKPTKTISFNDAFCVEYHEQMKEDGTHVEVITLSCRSLIDNNVKFENDWDGYGNDSQQDEDWPASVLSAGNIVIIAIVAVAAVGIIIGAVIFTGKRKKKTNGAEE